MNATNLIKIIQLKKHILKRKYLNYKTIKYNNLYELKKRNKNSCE